MIPSPPLLPSPPFSSYPLLKKDATKTGKDLPEANGDVPRNLRLPHALPDPVRLQLLPGGIPNSIASPEEREEADERCRAGRVQIEFVIPSFPRCMRYAEWCFYPVITQCCIAELYKLDKADQPIIDMAKTFERNKCNHKPAIAGAECIKTIIGQSFPSVLRPPQLSSRDGDRNKEQEPLRRGDPIRYATHAPPHHPRSPHRPYQTRRPCIRASERRNVEDQERCKHCSPVPLHATYLSQPQAEEQALRARKGEVPIDESATERPAKKIRGPKGPNPLSVLKKKPKAPLTPKPKPNPDPESGRKRKRNAEEGRDAQDGDASPAKRKRKRRRGAAHTEDGAEEPVASEET